MHSVKMNSINDITHNNTHAADQYGRGNGPIINSGPQLVNKRKYNDINADNQYAATSNNDHPVHINNNHRPVNRDRTKHARAMQPTRMFTASDKNKRLLDLLGYEYKSMIPKFQYDNEGLSSMTQLGIGRLICRTLVEFIGLTYKARITDAFAGIGGNTIVFAGTFTHINAVELNQKRAEMLMNNIRLFNVDKRVFLYTNYYQTLMAGLTQDVIFFDPPWGADYKTHKKLRLSVPGEHGADTPIEDLIITVAPQTAYIVVKLPPNYDIEYFAKCVGGVAAIVCDNNYYPPFSSRILYLRVIRQVPM